MIVHYNGQDPVMTWGLTKVDYIAECAMFVTDRALS